MKGMKGDMGRKGLKGVKVCHKRYHCLLLRSALTLSKYIWVSVSGRERSKRYKGSNGRYRRDWRRRQKRISSMLSL